MAKRKSKWQTIYDSIRNWKTPTTLKALINVAWIILNKFPKISTIAMRAFEVSKEVATEDIEGYLKKRKVVGAIDKIANELGVKLPTTVKNIINELCAIAIKLLA